jgi:hypothetical protein
MFVRATSILSDLEFSSALVRSCSVAVQPRYKVRVLVRPARFASYRPARTLDATQLTYTAEIIIETIIHWRDIAICSYLAISTCCVLKLLMKTTSTAQ